MSDLTPREERIERALIAKGWVAAWKGVPRARWLWASKRKGLTRLMTIEMTGASIVEIRAHGPIDWVEGTLAEFKRGVRLGELEDTELQLQDPMPRAPARGRTASG